MYFFSQINLFMHFIFLALTVGGGGGGGGRGGGGSGKISRLTVY